MSTHVLKRTQRIPIGIADAWAFFSDARNLAKLTPPEFGFELLTPQPDRLHPGLIIRHRMRPLFGVPVIWISEITIVDEPHLFTDEQKSGPFRSWQHEHRFIEISGGTEVVDTVAYALPFGPLGGAAHALFARRMLERYFDYRRRAVENLFGSMAS